jgi:transcriptional regulator with XRE-family HTH domain
MSTTEATQRYDKDQRDFLGEALARDIFSAIYTALTFRKKYNGLTTSDFADRVGRDRTGVSKILHGHGNWTTHKISDVANALDLEVEISFVDRADVSRVFTPNGVVYRNYFTDANSHLWPHQFGVTSASIIGASTIGTSTIGQGTSYYSQLGGTSVGSCPVVPMPGQRIYLSPYDVAGQQSPDEYAWEVKGLRDTKRQLAVS